MAKKAARNRALTVIIFILALVLAAMVALALRLPEAPPAPTTPPTQSQTPTPAPTDAPTDPPTVPSTDPPTDPPTVPPTVPPTNPPTVPPTDPPTNPPTVPPTDPPTNPPTAPPTAPQKTSMRLVTDAMARSGPSLDHEPVAELDMGTIVEIQTSENGWASFEYEGETCWLAEELLREPGKYLIVIDAGHQRHGNYDKEPNGPGSDELKAKVTSGTQGVATRLEEYKLNLTVSLKLQAELEARGYEVVMVRTEHDVDISNAQRAEVANELYADAFIRIHANSSEDQSQHGALTICQTKKNPYNSHLYKTSKALSEKVLDGMCAAAGCRRLYVWETDTMSGINWCQVPVTIVEMGFMSNPDEDRRMADDTYQNALVLGIANGLDAYFGDGQNIG